MKQCSLVKALKAIACMGVIVLFVPLYVNHIRSQDDASSKSVSRAETVLEEYDYVFCNDRFGRPIRRSDVWLAGDKIAGPEQAFMVIGMSSIKRRLKGNVISYLERSLESHLRNLTETERGQILIVIFLADQEKEKRDWIIGSLLKNYAEYIDNGNVQLIYAPKRFYSNLENLPRTFNDSHKRMKWRSKQALDFAFLAYYCSGLGKYYLHLEDDIESEAGYFKQIKGDLENPQINASPWAIRQYWQMGFIGKLIKSEFLKELADFWRIYYFEMPLDWSYAYFLFTIGRSGKEVIANHFPFKHIGKQSSSENDDIS